LTTCHSDSGIAGMTNAMVRLCDPGNGGEFVC
jgi:hypothetical protein